MSRRVLAGLGLVVATPLGLAGCGSDGPEHTVDVALSDYEVRPDTAAVEAGETTFEIDNDAGQVHELVVIKTDLAADDLPLDEDGLVDERGAGLEFVDEVEDLAGGSSARLTVELQPGTYLLLCNLPGHFAAGMHTELTVR